MDHPAKTINNEAVRFFLEKQGKAMAALTDRGGSKEGLTQALVGVIYASAWLATSLEAPAVKDLLRSTLLAIANIEEIDL